MDNESKTEKAKLTRISKTHHTCNNLWHITIAMYVASPNKMLNF